MSLDLDIGPLSWVKSEIDLALERAETLLKTQADAPGTTLGEALKSLHQAHGALAIVGLDGITEFSDAIENLFAKLVDGRLQRTASTDAAACDALAALRAYLDGLMADEPNQPLRLMPAYSALLVAAGEPAPSPAALFFPDLTQRPPRREVEPPHLSAEKYLARLKMARMAYERGLLKWLKADIKGLGEMRNALTMIESAQTQPGERAFWWVALAYFAALADGGFANEPAKTDARKMALKIGAEIKHLAAAPAGNYEVADRLMADLLYLVAIATPGAEPIEQVEVVRAAYRLDQLIPHTTHAAAEATRPLRRRLRELLAGAKDDWNKLCAGSAVALPPFHEKVAQIYERGEALEHVDIVRLSAAIVELTDALRRDPSQHTDAMALEVATALLLLDTALENFETLDADFSEQAGVVAERLEAVQGGDELAPFSLPHLDAMSRRAQERLLLASVAQEIGSNLGTVESTLDAYFRDTEKRATLGALDKPLAQIDGALAMLGHERAVSLLGDCRSVIASLAKGNTAPSAPVFEGLARTLSALGFFVEQLELGQKPDIDALLQPQRALVQAAVVPPEVLQDIRPPAGLPATPVAVPPASTPELVSAAATTAATPTPIAEGPDDELLEIFLEEADEVLATIGEQLPRLHAAPADQPTLVILRRSYHTLKGSGRMVGLRDFGESAWGVEQCLNQSLQDALPANGALLTMLDAAAVVFSAWVQQIRARLGLNYPATELSAQCAALLGSGETTTEAEAATTPTSAVEPPVVESSALELVAALEAREQAREAAELEAAELAAAEIMAESAQAHLDEPISPAADQETPASVDQLLLDNESTTVAPFIPSVSDEELLAAELAAADIAAEGAVAASEARSAELAELAESVEPGAKIHAFPAPPPVQVGELEISPALYAIYLDEARSHLAVIVRDVASEGVPTDAVIRAAHTLASTSGTTGVAPLHHLARALETALGALAIVDVPPSESQRLIFARCAGALEGMLGAVAERRMPGEEVELAQELAALQPQSQATALATTPLTPPAEFAVPRAEPEAQALAAAAAAALAADEARLREERRAQRLGDELDEQLLPIFLEESVELMASIDGQLRAWRHQFDNPQFPRQLQRDLHTLKGSARMTGAMGVGELLHSMESRIEQAQSLGAANVDLIDSLETSYDRAAMLIDQLRRGGGEADAETIIHPAATLPGVVGDHPEQGERGVDAGVVTPPPVIETTPASATPAGAGYLRVRADLVDKLVNEAGEVAISRARIEGEMRALKASLFELTENVIRLRQQVREIEIQAETQMSSQISELKAQAERAGRTFDPLELDRFTRFQELTRMMAESVNDVATVQQSLLNNLNHSDAALLAQARLNRELSQRLMSVRMVPFDSLAERLHRVVRQAAKESGKRANLDIRGGQMGVDRSVLERIGGPLEHLLRNAVAHGLELPEQRETAGKAALGQITISLAQEGNDLVLSLADDGGGVDLSRVCQRGLERGLLTAPTDDVKTLLGLLFQSGFSTAVEVTQLAGRGVGMDVVRNEVEGLGGHIEILTQPGQGSTFKLFLPLTLAVSQAVIIKLGSRCFALPSSMVEQASELKPEAIAKVRTSGSSELQGRRYPYFYLPRLLGDAQAQPVPARRHWLLLVKGGTERIALEVDGMVGNQEIVIKNLGPQLTRVPGIAGATVLGDGEIALILNPVALLARLARVSAVEEHVAAEAVLTDTQIQRHITSPGCVMVVDDSLTVRKITGRVLGRQGYHVVTAKDGVDALEQLSELHPEVMLVDVEMPRMDGFELTRLVRSDARLRDIPIIMITSRSAEKHRQLALELGVNHYLGKPYDEVHLLNLIAGYAKPARESAS